jgi:hypothetical protein
MYAITYVTGYHIQCILDSKLNPESVLYFLTCMSSYEYLDVQALFLI